MRGPGLCESSEEGHGARNPGWGDREGGFGTALQRKASVLVATDGMGRKVGSNPTEFHSHGLELDLDLGSSRRCRDL